MLISKLIKEEKPDAIIIDVEECEECKQTRMRYLSCQNCKIILDGITPERISYIINENTTTNLDKQHMCINCVKKILKKQITWSEYLLTDILAICPDAPEKTPGPGGYRE